MQNAATLLSSHPQILQSDPARSGENLFFICMLWQERSRMHRGGKGRLKISANVAVLKGLVVFHGALVCQTSGSTWLFGTLAKSID